MSRHRLLIGAINLLVLFAHRIIRMFDMYFSIVRRRAACASRDNVSASLMITTVHTILSRHHVKKRDRKPHTLKPMPRVDIDLLSLGDLLQNFLDDDSVIHSDFTVYHRSS